jgi:hypothetical protein
MTQAFPVIRYTGLLAYVEAYAKASYAYPVLSLFGAKTSVQAIAAALVSRKPEVFLSHGPERQEVWLTPGEYRMLARTLPCGAYHLLVINTQALFKQCTLPSFYIVSRPGEEEQLPPRYFSFLDRLTPIPLLKCWAGWLWERGIEKGEIEALEGYRLTAYECRVDLEGLKEDLSQAIRKKQLCLEVSQHEISRQGQGRVLSHPAISG